MNAVLLRANIVNLTDSEMERNPLAVASQNFNHIVRALALLEAGGLRPPRAIRRPMISSLVLFRRLV
jgi:hypothetical protein